MIHLASLLTIWTGFSYTALTVCVALYLIRMFAITAGYHRYFSHRSYKTTRIFQFILAFVGASAAQKGPLWWAASHRHHHKFSDTEHDLHSPGLKGLWWAHIGWVLSKEADEADMSLVRDLKAYPELCLLERYHYIPALLIIPMTYLLGMFLTSTYPELGTTPLQILAWGGFFSTVILYHGTFAINSLAHIIGNRRFKTNDESKNSFLLAIITLGEGWHNNHHRYPGSERQGFYWWELDVSHYLLRLLEVVGVVWDLRVPPKRIYDEARGMVSGA